MRHHNNIRKFGRNKNQRTALMKGLALSLITHERLETTEAKAKELRPKIEKLITKAKLGTLASKKLVASRLYERITETDKLIRTIAVRYKSRSGGYTRITKLPQRLGDGSKMALIELV